MRQPADIQLRGTVLVLAQLVLLLLLLGRLVQMQIIGAADWDDRSKRNQVRTQEIAPHRGLLLDRQGRILADNRPSYTLYGIPATLLKDSSAVPRLAAAFGWDPAFLLRRLKQGGRHSLKSVKLVGDITFDQRVVLAEHRLDFPGLQVLVEPRRHYPEPLAPHVLGHLGEVDEEELEKGLLPDGTPGDLLGRRGVERFYDADLRGRKGVEYLRVDVLGRVLGPTYLLPPQTPRNGLDLELGLDRDLQQLAESLLANRRGAILLMEVKSGRILAAVSAPDFQLEHFSGRMPPEVWATLNDADARPLLNRTIQGLYPPGSLFKPALAAWALEKGIIDENWSVTCTGALQLGRRTAHCWNLGGHGRVNLRKAIQQSCDVYFYQLGLRLNPDHIREAAAWFGLGEATGCDLDGEREGLLPDVAWFDKRFGKRGWSRGVMLNLAIGQGEILVTPMQMLRYAGLLASRGNGPTPHFGVRLIDHALNEERLLSYPRKEVKLSARTWALISDACRAVVEEPGGTAHGQKRARFQAAGKTGTAENPHGEAHAWYMGWMPEPDPELAAVVLVENAGHGSTAAAPLATALFEAWLDQKEGRWPPAAAAPQPADSLAAPPKPLPAAELPRLRGLDPLPGSGAGGGR
ncbi:MAG: penicillin-binding protein 2 [Candidatus Delongbacteria bacterium]